MAGLEDLVGPIPDGADPTAYDVLRRRVLWSLPTGIYLLGTRAGKRRHLMTTSLVMQVAVSPKLLACSVERTSVTGELIFESGVFALSLLTRDQRAVIRSYVKAPAHDAVAQTLSAKRYVDTPVTGSPVLFEAAGYIDCRVTDSHGYGSHTLVIGEVVDVDVNVGASAAVSGTIELLRMEDTRMNYGG